VPAVANYAASPLALWLGLGAFAARDGLYMAKRYIDGLRADRAKPNQARDEAE
jgi:hypothetical protein